MQEIIQFISHHFILSITWISLLVSILYMNFMVIAYKIKVISCGEVTHLINKKNALVIDLRHRNDFCKGHIVGAINLLPSEIKNSNLSKIDKYKNQPIVIVDSIGMQAHGSARILKKSGFSKIFILKEGISSWNKKNLPLVQR